MIWRPAVGALLAALALCLAAPPATAADPVLTPLVGRVLAAPRPVPGSDQRRHLVYEVQLDNVTAGTMEVQAVEIVDQGGNVVHRLDRGAVGGRLSIGGRRGAESPDLLFGQFAVLFVHVALGKDDALPSALRHRISLRFVPGNIDHTLTIAETPVNDGPTVVLGPPLVGKGYIAGDGCCDSIRHVRALLPLDGRFTLAQRFAIDWEQADAQNRLVTGDTRVPGNYTIFGKDVLAVADGTVVASRNDLPEQVPGALPKNLPLDQADGNFVVLDIGGGAHVLYAHMQPGSVTVTAGARVKRGDLLGKVGNTGNSQAPHLHLHVMDGPSALLANGIPYVFDSFTLTAIDQAGTADFDKAEATGSPLALTPVTPPQAMKAVLPLDLTVVEFSK
ncbi:MAG: M23 family metallopeptidase [Reyranellaceae bacterium]